MFTSPAGLVKKYCDEYACVCACLYVCLSVGEHISGTTRAIFTNFSVHVAYGRVSVLLRQGAEIPRVEQFWGLSSSSTMHCNAFAANVIGREGDDWSAQRGRSVIYNCRVLFLRLVVSLSLCRHCLMERDS